MYHTVTLETNDTFVNLDVNLTVIKIYIALKNKQITNI